MKKNFSATAKRTLIASAVASLMAGSAFAADTAATPVEGWVEQPKDLAVVDITDKSYVLVDDAKGLTGDFAHSTKGEVKTDAVHFASKKAETQVFSGRAWLDNSTGKGTKGVKGLATLAKDAVLVNEGSIFVKGSDDNYYMNQAMLADQGGTVENRGLIVTDKAYGMAIGSNGNSNGNTPANKLVNAGNGRIIVNGGAAMELGSGVDASSAENAGSIVVNSLGEDAIDSVGVLLGMSGDAVGTFTNTGSIVADEDAYAIKVDGGNADINLKAGSVRGDILIGGKASSTVGEVNLTINSDALVEGNLTAKGGKLTLKSADGAATLNGTLTVDGATVETAYGTVLTIDAPDVAREASTDLELKSGSFTVVEGSELNADTVNVTAGGAAYRLTVEGEANIETLNVAASNVYTGINTNNGELNIDTLKVTGTGYAIDTAGNSVITVSKAIETAEGTHAFAVAGESTLNLADGINLEKAAAGAIEIRDGTLSTNSAVYRKDGKIGNNDKIKTGVDSTVSFTDEAMTFEDLVALKAVTRADLETLANEITRDGKVLEKMKLADWKEIGGATLAPVTAVVEGNGEIGITERFGAKNIELTGEDSKKGTDDQISIKNGAEVTLVGGAQGTELVTSSHETKPIKLEKFFVTGGSTLNLGAANGTSFTYGTLSDGRLEVDGNSKVNVRNGDFTLAEGLSVNDGATVTVAEGATLRTPADLSAEGTPTTASIVNSGNLNVDGSLYAQTIDQKKGTLTVGGYLNAKNFVEGNEKVTISGGEVVLSGTKRTGKDETGWQFFTGGATIGSKLVAENDPAITTDNEEKGGLLVLGSAQAAATAEAYQAAHHLDNTLWIGQESHIDGVTFENHRATGTWNGMAGVKGENTVAFDVNAIAQSGYTAGKTMDETAAILNTKGKVAVEADKVYLGGLRNIRQDMLVRNADGIAQMKLGDVALSDKTQYNDPRVDFGTSFYDGSNALKDGVLSFNVDKEELAGLFEMGLHSAGAVKQELYAVQFGQQIADAIIFGWDQINEDYDRGVYNTVKGMLKDGVEFNDVFKDEYDNAQWVSENLKDGVDSLDYFNAINGYDNAFVSNLRDAEHAVTNMAALGGAFSTAVDINNEVWKALDRRTSLANLNVARNETGVTPWVDVIGTFNSADGLYGSSGYEADIYGAVFGADWTASCGAILGAAISVGQADANSVDNSTKVDNDVDFWGVSIYGSHQIGNVNGKFDLGYISTSNDLSANAAYFGRVKESLDADIFTIGIGAEYLASVGSVNVVPHAGFRWSSIDMDSSKYGADYDKMNLFQMPIGVTFSGTFDMTGWKVAPMFDISVVPAFGDKDAVASYTGGIEDSVRVVDANPIQATLGVNASVGAWTFGVNYGLTAGSDERLNNSLNANARYTF